jgi:HSP20 family protein
MANFGSLIPWRDKSTVSPRDDDRLDPFVNFRREVDRMFDDFFRGGFARMPVTFAPGSVMPSIDVEDQEKALVVTAELPGLDAKDIEVTLIGDVLTLKGEKKDSREETKGTAHYVERQFGSFSRSVRLPFEAGDENVEANYDKGILTVRVAKPEELTKAPKKIEVKSS